ncbi:serine/threonine-protein kinase VRK1 [Osmia lignaria lignaria]|uniref:serine/threonine-protein kinase VRK1 n=1 Tax=Osmia lignaria lignaria TaxID=1437193 RepID=UPI001479390A|nr:serine/threonine-protein kinase VRK1-like [Osmia lignaria]XP_034177517.1 serine/threonine-protein kinase VRK1-like [Osmia lignaria]XP_034177518.1 serine/threonine-protein kinase VRK1-like [Osmia lignaria]
MSSKVVKKPPKRKGANAYKLPDPISAGEILTDIAKHQWILGKSIGVGGFGEIYSAAPYRGKSPKEYPYVIKIEPHGNGPLFVEMHFYMRNAKPDEIDNWRKKKKLPELGMPQYIGSGSHEYKNTKYRFVVMNRYGTDLWKLFEANSRRFPEHTVYKIALQIINILEYIHHKTYVHADIKGANLLLDLTSENQVYLVDFGLASHYSTKNEYKLDPKKAHNGTIEYTSRDAHMGVPTMRGDFEILGYNMIQWLCGSLLWEKNLSDPVTVQKQKEKAFENISEFLNKCFNGSVPKPILEYMTLLASMKFNDTPNYEKFKKIISDGLKQLSHKPDGKLEFKSDGNSQKQIVKTTPQRIKKTEDVIKRSPRIRARKNLSPVKSLDDSTVGIIMDKKRGGVKDIKQILNNIESDEEYDIKIVKKKKKPNDFVNKSKDEKIAVKNRRRIQKNYNDSISDSEPEIISKGTRSRPIDQEVASKKTRANPRKALIQDSASDEDIFDM